MDLIQISKIPPCQGFQIPDSIEGSQAISVGFQLVLDLVQSERVSIPIPMGNFSPTL